LDEVDHDARDPLRRFSVPLHVGQAGKPFWVSFWYPQIPP
jgi:hypothetical protein